MNSVTIIKVVFAPVALVGVYLLIRLVVPGPVGVVLAVLTVLGGLWLVVRTVRKGRT